TTNHLVVHVLMNGRCAEDYLVTMSMSRRIVGNSAEPQTRWPTGEGEMDSRAPTRPVLPREGVCGRPQGNASVPATRSQCRPGIIAGTRANAGPESSSGPWPSTAFVSGG